MFGAQMLQHVILITKKCKTTMNQEASLIQMTTVLLIGATVSFVIKYVRTKGLA